MLLAMVWLQPSKEEKTKERQRMKASSFMDKGNNNSMGGVMYLKSVCSKMFYALIMNVRNIGIYNERGGGIGSAG